ncbi:MAG: carboxylesterase/lipase family protein [Alphaproteobacteria bacterium]|nr:carboxylesterase family protein [Alphaproteobacteria bacterium]MDE2110589.1 carboxylesterase/lipase family protein [Alphaproteobacteria bacterium]MDE2492683.1 carboxylesterase/lipase family protein [Alphaproteobacteria bacterium]
MFAKAALAVLLFAFGQALAAPADTLAIDGGKIAVAAPTADGVRVYKGLPYAAPPIGDLRWREPAAVIPWSGVRAVNAFAPNCLQPKVFHDIDPFNPSMSEDCLYLNIWTAAKPGEARPVFVWIHGGGYQAGYGAEPRHDGTVLAEKGLVVVTINYRLGVFGFLAHPELTAESPHHASGDYALMDMIAALRWVRRNIATFGGDPNRVTIAGESAGSDAVSRLMASPEAHGLFQRAIGESGAGFGTTPDDTLATAEAKGEAFARAMDGDTIAQLRKRSSAELLALEVAPNENWGFGPDIDGWILPAPPSEIFAAGKQNDVSMLVGWNADEGSLFEDGFFGTRSLSDALAARFGDRAAEAAKFYPSSTADELRRSRETYAGDEVIAQPTWMWADAQIKTGHAPVYLYVFDRHPPIPPDWFGAAFEGKEVGAFHSGEIPYVFGHPDIFPSWNPTADDRALADQMSSDWAAFAASGDPNGEGRPAWPAYDPNGTAQRMVFDAVSAAAYDSDLARRRFLQETPTPTP